MITLYADKNDLTVQTKELLTSGAVNVNKCHFDFSDDWDKLEKTILFRTRNASIASILDDEGNVNIPPEVLSTPYLELSVGVYGTDGNTSVLPTIWASLGIIANGVNPGATQPGASIFDMLLTEIAKKGDGLKYENGTLSLLSGEKIISNVELETSMSGMTQEEADKRYLKQTGGSVKNAYGSRVNVCEPENTEWISPLEVREVDNGLMLGGDIIAADHNGEMTVDLVFGDDSFSFEKSESGSDGTISLSVGKDKHFISVDGYNGLSCALHKDGLEALKNRAPIGGFYIEEGKIRFHSNDASGNEIPAVLSGLADPVLDDEAATKKYVDAQSENAVKKTGARNQSVEGGLVLSPSLQGDYPFLSLGGSEDGRNAEIRPGYLYFERWGSEDGDDFALAIYAKSRDEAEGAGFWIPVLEFEDSGSGGPGVILAGVNVPTEDYDAANKKYVDEAIAALTARIEQLEARLSQTQQEATE